MISVGEVTSFLLFLFLSFDLFFLLGTLCDHMRIS